jgi:hypothetical protein
MVSDLSNDQLIYTGNQIKYISFSLFQVSQPSDDCLVACLSTLITSVMRLWNESGGRESLTPMKLLTRNSKNTDLMNEIMGKTGTQMQR